jgi:hypothetical protein
MYDGAMTWLSRFGLDATHARPRFDVAFRFTYQYLAMASVVVPVQGTKAA